MISYAPLTSILAFIVVTIVLCLTEISRPQVRFTLGFMAPLSLLGVFASLALSGDPNSVKVLVPGVLELNQISCYGGALFNFVYCIAFLGFGQRVFATKSAGYWLILQLLISLGLLCENMEIFSLFIVAALITHLKVSQSDVYQVSRKQDGYIVVVFCSIVAVCLSLFFFLMLRINFGLSTFSELTLLAKQLPRYMKISGSVLMMLMLGAFPLHFWVKPLFAAPSRYGLAVITRLNIGFVVWCKLYQLVFSGDPLLDSMLTFGCGANLVYAAFLLFGERRLSQIVSALYLFHVPLLILAVKVTGRGSIGDFALDFANITVAISGLLIILSMLRERLGAENIDRATGLGISYPFLGISFLICVLSLVGFPGTLGFISSEVMLHHFAESTWFVAVSFIITLALNGYSSFRIFGESFYGDPAQSFRRILQPLAREKLAIAMILLFLFLSGIGPQLIAAQN